MRSVWIGFASAAGAGLVALAVFEARARLERLESTPRADPAEVTALRGEIARLRADVACSTAQIDALSRGEPRASAVAEHARALERELDSARCAILEQGATIARLESERDWAPIELEERLGALHDDAVARVDVVRDAADAARNLATSARDEAEGALRALARDEERMWSDLMGPTVQVSGEETVGSGVLLASEPTSIPGEHETFVLTAWHVIRDLERDGNTDSMLVPVSVYARDGAIEPVTARVARHDPTLDVALLRLESTRAFPCGAKLARRERLDAARVFDRIYAVGCPLGNDPIPTFGEIADLRHRVDGQRYWMISAPTYIGNSGGGVFDASTHELVGLFTKIYTHGSLRPMVVPHMGLATPLADVYDWLEDVGFASLEPEAQDIVPRTAASAR